MIVVDLSGFCGYELLDACSKMNTLLKAAFVPSLALASFSLLAPGLAHAQSAAVVACVKSMTSTLGVSPDVAFGECNKKTLVECIKLVSESNFVATSIRREGGGHLIDLGSNSTRWLEGGAWKSHGCEPYIPGPQRITQTISSWNTNKHQWFRQAVCPQDVVELDQPYGVSEAKLLCETDSVPQRLKDAPENL